MWRWFGIFGNVFEGFGTMRKSIISFALLILATGMMQGQLWKTQRIEINAGLGPTHLFGDIGGFTDTENYLGLRDITLAQTRFNISLGANYRVLEELNARLSLTYAMFNSNDKRGSNVARGFISTTSAFETSLLGEYYFIKNRAERSFSFSRKGSIRNRPRSNAFQNMITDFFTRFDMYAFTGLGGLAYSVSPNDLLADRDLKDGGFTMVWPLGIGAKYIYSPDLNFGLEFGGRYAFSDYIDGYTSQFSSHNDIYYFLNVTATYKLPTIPRYIRRR